MDIGTALLLIKELTTLSKDIAAGVIEARAHNREEVLIDQLGTRVRAVNDKVQAARGPQDPT